MELDLHCKESWKFETERIDKYTFEKFSNLKKASKEKYV